jgi:hypothetical protein
LVSPPTDVKEWWLFRRIGNDAAPGTLVKLFATLKARARGGAPRRAGKRPATINLRGGTHYLPAPCCR